MSLTTELGKRGRFSKVSIQARSSGGERYLDTVEVLVSNPILPAIKIRGVAVTAGTKKYLPPRHEGFYFVILS